MNSLEAQPHTSSVDAANLDRPTPIAPTPIDHGGFDAHA